MAKGSEMGSSNFGQLLGDIPSMVSCNVYSYFNKNGKYPRLPTVFKMIKEDLKNEGYPFNTFTDVQKYEIEEIVRDAFYGMKDEIFGQKWGTLT